MPPIVETRPSIPTWENCYPDSGTPLQNDPYYETIGLGTRIFLGGGQGYVIGEGTQHNPKNRLGNIMVKGNAKVMDSEFIRGAAFTKYGISMYNGVGIPIPILNEGIVEKVAIRDENIYTDIEDYGTPRRSKPNLGKVNYKELKSGSVTINDRKVKVTSLSSLKTAHKICDILKDWISESQFYLTKPVYTLSTETEFKPLKETKETHFVGNIMHSAVTCREDEDIKTVAKRLIENEANHVVVLDNSDILEGIVTAWDITKSVANGNGDLEDIIVRRVHTTSKNEPVETASRRMAEYNISALPVVASDRRLLGIITSEDISKLLGGAGSG